MQPKADNLAGLTNIPLYRNLLTFLSIHETLSPAGRTRGEARYFTFEEIWAGADRWVGTG